MHCYVNRHLQELRRAFYQKLSDKPTDCFTKGYVIKFQGVWVTPAINNVAVCSGHNPTKSQFLLLYRIGILGLTRTTGCEPTINNFCSV